MIEKLKGLCKNRNQLIVIILIGVLLMVIALPVDGLKSATKEEEEDMGNKNNTSYQSVQEGTVDLLTMETYVERMEEKIGELLSDMEGAGKVKVIVTLSASMERIVEKETPMVRSNTTEEAADGGTRRTDTMDSGDSVVYTSKGNETEPYVIKTISPTVEGILVLAEGADSGTVNKNISDALQVLFGIEAHKVKVVKMNEAK